MNGTPLALVFTNYVNLVIVIACVAVELWALVHCAIQRSDAFAAIGTLGKGMWLGLLAGTMLLSVLLSVSGFGAMFALIALAAALVYLLDVRPALKDISGGRGSW
jgi:hypothetical protein